MQNQTTETWRDIPGLKGMYQASSLGRIKRLPRKYFAIYKGTPVQRLIEEKIYECKSPHKKGYLRVSITMEPKKQKHFMVHTLVALTFLGPRPEGMQVNHKNGIKQDNRPENLEYVTNQQNRDHAVANGLNASRKNSKHGNMKLSFAKIQEVKYLYSKGMLQKDIADRFGVCQQTISIILRQEHSPA